MVRKTKAKISFEVFLCKGKADVRFLPEFENPP